MKTVNEIREIANDRYRYPVNVTNGRIFEILIGITEHLEAQEKPCAGVQIGRFMDDGLRGEVRREAMIKALRWAHKNAICNHQLCGAGSPLLSAIARLENGGSL